jgi:hypothetical protein
LEWNLVPEVLKLILFAAGSGRIPNRIIATLLRPMLQQQLHSAVTRSLTTKSSHRRVRPTHRNAHAARTFASEMMEAMMPFSLSSYLLGVGTVVGALAFGFGGGVLLTKTAMKDSSPAESRVERVARAEPASPPPQAVEAKSAPTPPAEPRPPATSLPEAQANAEPPKPVAEAPREAAPARTVESMSQTEPKKPPEPSTKPLEQSTKPADQKEAELRKAEERNKRYAERKARDIAAARARQRQLEEQRESSRPVFAYEREEPQLKLFDMPLFGRSRDISPFDRDD